MNLELLQSQRQLPDRIDATLSLPTGLHHLQKKKSSKNNNIPGSEPFQAANCVAFNRRGTYAAVGYESGTVAVFDVLSRTLSAFYRSESHSGGQAAPGKDASSSPPTMAAPKSRHSVSFLSWSKRSRSILAGTANEPEVRLIDTTHPYGPEECSALVKRDEKDKSDASKGDDEGRQTPTEDSSEKKRKRLASPLFIEPLAVHLRTARNLSTQQLKKTTAILPKPGKRTSHQLHKPANSSSKPRYPLLNFKFPHSVRSSLQIHPKDVCAGIAVLVDGSLAAFWVPVAAWEDNTGVSGEPSVQIAIIYHDEDYEISSASFDPDGDKIYAGTAAGNLLGFEVATIFETFASGAPEMPTILPSFVIRVPGGAFVSQVEVNRTGTSLILNSVDAAIRLYSTKECWTTPEEVEKPTRVFQDSTSKVIFRSCDFSGDGEIVLAGSNGTEKEYALFMWSAATGELVDKLSGAPLELKCVACHPTRSFLAAAVVDGLVDIWGPRVNWTAFAPSFEALTANIEYVECEDEFDAVDVVEENSKIQDKPGDESADVDVVAIHRILEFNSDSEDEEDVFTFQTKIKPIFGLYTN